MTDTFPLQVGRKDIVSDAGQKSAFWGHKNRFFFLPIFFKDVDTDMTCIPSSAGMVDALQVNSAAIASLWISCFNFQLLVFIGA